MDGEQETLNSDDYWRARIAAALALDELDSIDKDLEALGSGARKWRFAVAVRRNALKGNATPGVTPKSNSSDNAQTSTPKTPFATAYGLPAPDGRRLHGYRLTANNFSALQADLAQHRSYKRLDTGYNPGLFALWASEWFRRSYRGGSRNWDSLTSVLGLPQPGQIEQNVLRDITRSGLKQWGRPVYSQTSNQYLATLAREGGFPAYAVAAGAQGWAKAILEAIVQRLMRSAATNEIDALALAEEQAINLPGVFKDQEFIQLCADLAFAIVKVRRDYEPAANAEGMPLASWLKLNQPNWHNVLPISTGEAEADKLIEALIQVEAIKGSVVTVERFLLRDPFEGAWREAVRLVLDGEISAANMASVDKSHGRLRAFAAGAMAKHLPGELALFDPPAFDANTWSVRSSRDARGIRPLPFNCALQIDLRAGSRLISQVDLPGGKPRRGQLLVCVLEEGDIDVPRALRVVGSGSGSYRQSELFLQVPANWAVFATDQGSITDLGAGVGQTKIWRVTGGARLTDPTNDIYKVLCGQSKDQAARIDLIGSHPRWASVEGDVDLFAGPPHVSKSAEGNLVVRQLGSSLWKPAPASLPIGHYELGLRQDGIMVDRRRVAVLPVTANITTVFKSSGAEFELTGFEGVAISPAGDAPVQASAKGDRWLPKPVPTMAHCFSAKIDWQSATPLMVTIAYPVEASIATWDGRILPHRSILTIDDLSGLVAVDQGDMVLLAHLRDPKSSIRAEMSWSFSREMPMSAIALDIASVLLPTSIDAEVVLDMNNGINTNWHVRQFPLELKKEGTRFVASEAIVDDSVELWGRSFLDPLVEQSFGPYSLLSDSNHRPIALPDELHGDWLVYLRRETRVLTRPQYVRTVPSGSAPVGILAQAMAAPFGAAQDQALAEFLKLAGSDEPESAAALAELLKLVESLKGLPPVTFNVLTKLPAFPDVLARLAYCAQPDQRDAVMGLAFGLPFAWFTIAKCHWKAAEQAFGQASMELFKDLGADAPRFSLQRIEMARKAISERQPLLAPVLGECDAVPLGDAAQAFMRHAVQQIQTTHGTRYRARLATALPAYFQRFNQQYYDTLDAPCAAALAVRGEWNPTPSDIQHFKLIERTFPTWFSEAFAVSLQGYS
ncbi:STY4851/ECs_5259 family protein [Polymorphobacter fuscus]|uniref:Uncharacterized protein n=1 Tax=Sandarakinorhabdus fusca TaxID=1439888 RepID=A0A7C9GP70_9SPHN|nr:STY4851/ECs_5259 family protein [Polymorphobacter fuscus]KAB7646115.1 hypothetical protein F9290_08555 [Polymorphobacter fuscus]MQT17312.1 hypothetical protein [Polymorphobacter fuscus]NJC10155.1 hypothetical protein [Polymorphobacter fuscus]